MWPQCNGTCAGATRCCFSLPAPRFRCGPTRPRSFIAPRGARAPPSLFRSPTTLAVAAAMAEVGFQTVDASEPSDSVAGELSFLSALLGSAAVALQAQDEATARAMVDRARRFWDEHAARWLPSFMGQAQREASSREGTARWRLLAQWGSLVLAALSESDAVFGGARV